MAEPFLAEIRMVSFDFPARGWARCDGQLLPINQNQALFSLLGTHYGGDGEVSFALPDLRGRTPIHMGNGHNLGQRGGEQDHTLTWPETAHAHPATHVNADDGHPRGNMLAVAPVGIYRASGTAVSMNGLSSKGGSQAHDNMQPSQVLNFMIALTGIFPSSN